mmetsp:Transcript_66709/g.193187  ORF Transcript_66709/g.193187 Transcript_66709/m.193187 type:complete len:285 (+) Transcript_66709:791-1645(+)
MFARPAPLALAHGARTLAGGALPLARSTTCLAARRGGLIGLAAPVFAALLLVLLVHLPLVLVPPYGRPRPPSAIRAIRAQFRPCRGKGWCRQGHQSRHGRRGHFQVAFPCAPFALIACGVREPRHDVLLGIPLQVRGRSGAKIVAPHLLVHRRCPPEDFLEEVSDVTVLVAAEGDAEVTGLDGALGGRGLPQQGAGLGDYVVRAEWRHGARRRGPGEARPRLIRLLLGHGRLAPHEARGLHGERGRGREGAAPGEQRDNRAGGQVPRGDPATRGHGRKGRRSHG